MNSHDDMSKADKNHDRASHQAADRAATSKESSAHGFKVPRGPILVPTQTKQSWYFIIGGSLFAVGAAAAVWSFGGANLTNWLCFIGAWFFTAGGLTQLALSGDATVPVPHGRGKAYRAEWLAAATQSFGTILFNVSTSAALSATTIDAEKHYMWNPDAGGSVAFLISAVLVYIAFYRSEHTIWAPRRIQWWGAHINMVGCIAFAASAVGAFVLDDGTSKDANLANIGTLVGAICFVVASVLALPSQPWNRVAALRSHKAAVRAYEAAIRAKKGGAATSH